MKIDLEAYFNTLVVIAAENFCALKSLNFNYENRTYVLNIKTNSFRHLSNMLNQLINLGWGIENVVTYLDATERVYVTTLAIRDKR